VTREAVTLIELQDDVIDNGPELEVLGAQGQLRQSG